MSAAPTDPVQPTTDEAALAKELSRKLSPYSEQNLKLQIPANGHPAEMVELPASAVRLLVQILVEMAAGNAITLIPLHAELTTQQAANLLNVSRPFLVGLLEQAKIPYKKVGTHRRILTKDLLEYKRASDQSRSAAVHALIADGEESDPNY